jgi:hypothetical protein
MAFVTDTDLASTASGKGAEMVGFIQDAAGAVARTASDKLREFKTFEDFGAVGDFDPVTKIGTDDTAAIQAALDWAFAGNSARAIHMTGKNFLCGQITLYPYSTIVGTGRQTSAFWCVPETTGKWFSDRGNGAQKVTLYGITFLGSLDVANDPNLDLTHVLELGGEGVQYGTEAMLRDLVVRDAPDAIGLSINGNVGVVENVTGQTCLISFQGVGNGNQYQNLFSMQAGEHSSTPTSARGIDVSGGVIRGVHVEAPVSGSLPMRINGDCHVSDVEISLAVGTSFDHVIEVDTSVYDEWSLGPVQFLTSVGTITGGIVKVGTAYYGGTAQIPFSGLRFEHALDVSSGKLAIKHQALQGFSLRIANDAGTITHNIGSQFDPGGVTNYAGRINGASVVPTATPTGTDSTTAFAAGGKISNTYPSMFLFDTAAQSTDDQLITGSVAFNNCGTALTAWVCSVSVNVNGVTRQRIAVQLSDAATGAAFNLTTLPTGKTIVLALQGFVA